MEKSVNMMDTQHTAVRIHPAIQAAYAVLAGDLLSRQQALDLALHVEGEDVLDLISLANKVRHRFAAPMAPCSIINAKSGRCGQNCRFCAQSAAHETGIETYAMLEPQAVLEAARHVYAQGVRTFGYVTSGYGYLQSNAEFETILETLDLLHAALPDMRICVSIGILSRETAQALAQHHAWRYNMNLQTNPKRYAELIADTHSIQDKIATIRHLQAFGVTQCTGGIFGLGETWEDRVDLAFAIRDLNVEGIPLNVLLPIPGTPLATQPVLRPLEVAKAFAIFRLINPEKMIKFAAGRETVMKDFQGLLMLAGANSMITGGYLTTRGRSVADDTQLIEQLNEF